MSQKVSEQCKEELKFEINLRNDTSEPKSVNLFKKNTNQNFPTIYVFTTPFIATYNTGTQFRFKVNGNDYNFTLSSNTTRENIIPLLNSFNIGTWSLDPSVSNNIFKATTLSDNFQELEIVDPAPQGWIIRVSPADNDWRSVAWSSSLNLFVAVSSTGSGDRVMTSQTGT